jgi:hypothetical protein
MLAGIVHVMARKRIRDEGSSCSSCRELGLCGWRCDETGEAVVATEDTGKEEDATKHFEMVVYEWRTKFETAGCFRMDSEDSTGNLLVLYVSFYLHRSKFCSEMKGTVVGSTMKFKSALDLTV